VPRYFFHIRDGDRIEADEFGVDLSGTEAVREEALITAGQMVRDAARAGQNVFARSFEVVDEAGAPVLSFAFAFISQEAPR
jgi:hypothetical protein